MRSPHRIMTAAAAMVAALTTPSSAFAQEAPAPFANEIADYVRRDEARMPPPCGLLFVGSSSVRLWPSLEKAFLDHRVIQRGFGGSQTEHANRYFDELVAKYHPSAIVLYEGENDLDAGKSLDQVEADLRSFLALKDSTLGSTPVYFISVKPSPARWAQFDRQSALNARMRALAVQRDDVVYVDVVAPMLDHEGRPKDYIFLDDRLHMNGQGYAIWEKQIARALEGPAASRAPQCNEGMKIGDPARSR